MTSIRITPKASDYIGPSDFENITFRNVENKGMVYMWDPNPKWANKKDCGEFPCTAPKNTVYSFKGTKVEGPAKPTLNGLADFQIVPDVKGYTSKFPTCKLVSDWNAYQCNTEGLGILLFESEDPDKFDRSLQPVYLEFNGDATARNKLNSYMDHVWDGFYAGQIRRSRFPGLVYGGKQAGKAGAPLYTIVFTGTPAKKFRFTFLSHSKTAGITVKIAYPGAESRQVEKDGKVIEYNAWDRKLKPATYGEIKQTRCGENRFTGVKAILEFYITANCELHIAPRDAIQTEIRMEWDMKTFFAKGGTTAFVDRLCASLGIHASTVKVVSVYEGSLKLNYEIAPSKDEPMSLAEIKRKQTEKFATGKMDLGAPILDVTTGTTSVIKDGVVKAAGFAPVILVATSTNAGDAVWINWFQPWFWQIYKACLLNAPIYMFYNFIAYGLIWMWNELG